ncbi:MAG: hypothetical protein COB78_05705 [Hyphomicrobiales bacterium]|nr:MAG: hypothetical protein COB78_05705 [Hyphomicrobiales bacterium]
MLEKTKLSPVKGRLVSLENGQPWPVGKDGKEIDHPVVKSRYYRRRLADGDLRDKEAEAVMRKAEADARKIETANGKGNK